MLVTITGFGIDGAGLVNAFMNCFPDACGSSFMVSLEPQAVTLGPYTVKYVGATLATLGSSAPTLSPTPVPTFNGELERFAVAPISAGACTGTVKFNADLPSQASGSFTASILEKYDNNADCRWTISASYARHGLMFVRVTRPTVYRHTTGPGGTTNPLCRHLCISTIIYKHMFTYRSGSTLTLKVDSFDLEAGYDLLHIFEGTEAGTDIFTKLDPLKTFTIHCHTGRTDPYARFKNLHAKRVRSLAHAHMHSYMPEHVHSYVCAHTHPQKHVHARPGVHL